MATDVVEERDSDRVEMIDPRDVGIDRAQWRSVRKLSGANRIGEGGHESIVEAECPQ